MHIEGKYKEGRREEGIKRVVDFYTRLRNNAKGFKGFIMTENLNDEKVVANLSFWENKEDMDNYYTNNKEYSSFLESMTPLIENIERKEYKIVGSNLNI